MPRLGRFLFGDWLGTESLEALSETAEAVSFGASYRDGESARHQRGIALHDDHLEVEDRIEGFSRSAVLRWRLAPRAGRVEGCSVTDGAYVLSVQASMPIERFELTTGWESRFYMQRTELPVLEVEVRAPGKLVSSYRWPR